MLGYLSKPTRKNYLKMHPMGIEKMEEYLSA